MATAWVLTKGLDHWRSQVNARFPNRDHLSDGTIGDLAHQNESASGHNPDITGKAEWRDGDKLNEVRAWDMDSDLRDVHGVACEQFVQHLVTLGKNGTYLPFRYFIYNRRIWKKSVKWKQEDYTGASAHTEHVHFSGDFTEVADNWDGSLGISTFGIPQEVDVVTIEPADIDKIAKAVWDYKLDINVSGAGAPNLQPAGGLQRYASSEHHAILDAAKAGQTSGTSAVSLLTALAARPEVDETALADELATRLGPLLDVDSATIAKAVRDLFTQEANTVSAAGQ
jgi:hypothetical protein